MKLINSDDPILKQKTIRWDFENHVNAAVIEREMLELMKSTGGIGLAANQVGLDRSVFVMKLADGREMGFFNPAILYAKGSQLGEEGCLSFPNLWLKVERYEKLQATYLDNTGKRCIIELEGIDARFFQHELDHLEGVCFTDGVSKLKLDRALQKQRKLNGRTK